MLTILKYKLIQLATLGCSESEGKTSNRITIFTNGMTLFALVMAILINVQMADLGAPLSSRLISLLMLILPVFILILNHRQKLFYARFMAYLLAMISGANAALFFGKSFNGYYLMFVPLFYSILAFSRSRLSLRLSLLFFAIFSICVIDWLSHSSIIPLTGLSSKDFPVSVLIFDTLCFSGLTSIMIWVEKSMADRHEQNLMIALDQIAQQKQKIKTIFDNVDVGILSCNREGKVEPDFSKKIEQIFPNENLDNREFIDLLFSKSDLSSDQLSIIKNTLFVCLGEDNLNWEMNKSHLVKELCVSLENKKKYLNLTWAPLLHKEIVSKIIVSIEDVTQEKENENRFKKEKRLQSYAQGLAQVIIRSSSEQALQLVSDLQNVSQRLQSYENSFENDLMHDLHSLKGNTRFHRLDEISDMVHDLESLIAEPESLVFKEKVEQFMQTNDEFQAVAKHLFGKLSVESSNWTLYQYLGELRFRIEEQLRESNVPNRFQTLSIDDKVWAWPSDLHKPLQTILSHGIQNSIDHGYLLPELQDSIHISVSTEQSEKGFYLYLDDFGRGLNQAYIEKQWESLDPHLQARLKSPEDLLFIDKRSSAEKVTKTSGRGVGLSAIKSLAEQLEGEVTISNHPDHRGTRLSLFIPKKSNEVQRAG